MAARKKSTKSARSKTARKKTVSSAKRPHRASRAAPKKSSKGSGKSAASSAGRGVAAAGGKRSSPRKNGKKTGSTTIRRKETHQGGKATVTGGVKKTLKPDSNGVAVAEKLNGKAAEAKLQAKTVQKIKAQARSEAAALTISKTETATVPAAKAAEEAASVSATSASSKAAAAPVRPKPAVKDEAAAPSKTVKAPAGQRQGFKLNEFVVYPAHGVGQIVAIEEQEVAGFRLELFVISFSKDKMTLRVPTSKVTGVGMRKISDPDTAKRSLDILSGRARIKRTMWSRRAQEYETKINSGDIAAIAEVVRDLYRSEAQPEQSYSERQLYEAALDRMVREIAAVQKSNEIDALKAIESQLQKTHIRPPKPGSPEVSDPEIEEAA